MKSRLTKTLILDIVTYIIMIMLVFLWLLPIYVTVSTSFKTRPQIFSRTPLVIFTPTLGNYVKLFEQYDFLKWMLNSFTISLTLHF